MFVFKREGHAITNTGNTFRRFMNDGYESHRPNVDDWKTHLNTIFTEVRLKKTIEVRGADVQKTDMVCALPALWTGLLYDDRALAEAEGLVEGWTHDEVAEPRTRVWKDGLRVPRIMRTSGSALFASSTVKYLCFFSAIGLAGAM